MLVVFMPKFVDSIVYFSNVCLIENTDEYVIMISIF